MLSSKPEQQQRDQTTTPGTTFPALLRSLLSLYYEDIVLEFDTE